MPEEPLFPLDAATISSQGVVRADDSVAWHEDTDGFDPLARPTARHASGRPIREASVA